MKLLNIVVQKNLPAHFFLQPSSVSWAQGRRQEPLQAPPAAAAGAAAAVAVAVVAGAATRTCPLGRKQSLWRRGQQL